MSKTSLPPSDLPTITIQQAHVATTADGTPILRSIGAGKRVRYSVQPQPLDDEVSQASSCATTTTDVRSEWQARDGIDLVAPPPRACICPSCSKLVQDPVAGPCGHAYCRSCATPERCLVCSKALSPHAMRSSTMTSWLVDSLEALCPNAGCTRVCRIKALAAHAAECEHTVVPCPHAATGCPVRLPRAELQAHRKSCPFELLGSFVTSTLARLEAVEQQNRSLRAELRVLNQTMHWQEQSSATCRCADCGALYFETSEEEGTAEAEALKPESAGGDAYGVHTEAGDAANSGAPRGHCLGRCFTHHRPDEAWREQQ
eukprot:3629880-Prymnesium_polylepis.1